MCSVRAFLAVPLPPGLKEAIGTLQKTLRTGIPEARWTHPENLHLTLHFFGETTQESLEKIRVSMLSVKGCQRPFTVDVIRLGAFPGPHRPRVIWLGLEPGEPLRQLHERCLSALHAGGVATEQRPYSPHLTIGRMRQQKPDLAEHCRSVARTAIGRLPVDRLILYESRLHPGGAEHIPLFTVNLDDRLGNPEQTG